MKNNKQEQIEEMEKNTEQIEQNYSPPDTKLPKKEKKKPNIIFFFILLVFIFIIFEQVNPVIYQILGRAIIFGRYSREVILEAICFAIILVVILLAGNKYIFFEKKNKLLKSIGVGGAMFGIATFLFIGNSLNLVNGNLYDVISLALYCLFIGLFEEFMCRGWIQNELIERYSKNRNQAYLSIVLSSLIFGGMHISNIWIGGQGVVETLSQVIQATGMGIYLGAIYYRTKNIWANVFLHGFWDFALLLGEIDVIKSCSEGAVNKEYIISQLITATIFFFIYSLLGLYILRKSRLTDQFTYTEEEIKLSEVRKGRIVFAIIVLFLSISYFAKKNENEVCYSYNEKDVVITETVSPKYKAYYFNDSNVRIKLYIDNGVLKIKDLDSQYEKEIDIDYPESFIVVKDKDIYHVLVVGLNEYQTDTVLHYSSFFTSSKMTNEQYYIDNFTNSFSIIESAPTINEMGYFYSYLDDITYPYIVSSKNDKLLLYDKELYTINEKRYDSFIEETE